MGQCVSRKVLNNWSIREVNNWSIREVTDCPGNVHVISSKEEWDAELSNAAAADKTVIAAFTASWCGPCEVVAPQFFQLSDKYPQLLFLDVDVNDMNELSEEGGIRAVPTFVFIKNGKEIERMVGANMVELQKRIDRYATIVQ